MKKLFLGYFLLFIAMNPLIAQKERIALTTDRSVYFTGDHICFRPWLQSVESSSEARISVIVYVEFLDFSGKVLVQLKSDTRNQAGSGTIVIPDDLPSGHYFIRAYTNVLRNQGPASYALNSILVLNPSNAGNRNWICTDTLFRQLSLPLSEKTWTDLPFRLICPDSLESGKNSDLFIQALPTGKVGPDLCLSIAAYIPTTSQTVQTLTSELYHGNKTSPGEGNLLPPEYYSDVLSGRIQPMEGNKGTGTFFLSVPGDSSLLFLNKILVDGQFLLPVYFLHGMRNLSIGCLDTSRKEYFDLTPEFDPHVFFPDSLDLKFIRQTPYLNEAYLRWQCEKLFSDPVRPANSPSGFHFYGAPDFQIKLKEYAELPTMEEIFFELVKPVMVLHKNKMIRLRVIDKETNRTIGDRVLYLIDGIPVLGSEEVLSLTPSMVESISVLCRKVYLGPETFDGIIDIKTRQKNYYITNKSHSYSNLSVPFASRSKSFLVLTKPVRHQPAVSNLLCWYPSVMLSDPHDYPIKFYSGDFPGVFILTLTWLDTIGNQQTFSKIIRITRKD